MQSMKETVSNIGASAKSGMDKTKAVMQEKMEKMSAHDETQKALATEKKDSRLRDAELHKQEEFEQNAAAKMGGSGSGSHSYSTTTGVTGQSTGTHQMSALPGHGSGQPAGQVVEGTVKSHPVGTATGTRARSTTAHNTHVGGAGSGYGTGGGYNG